MNLSTTPQVFVGREHELARLAALFKAGERLVTIVGFGGIGKTTLGARLLVGWGEPVVRCLLAEAEGEAGLVRVVARALGASNITPGAGAIDELGEALARSGRCLVFLDNLEHLVTPATRALSRWLALAPDARFLATSRERLELRAEIVVELSGLTLPVGDDESGVKESEAGRLFLSVAGRRSRHFRLDDAAAPAVAEIVRAFEGIPLAIELLARRADVLTPQQLQAGLAAPYGRLGHGPVDAPARHRTLDAAIGWSWALLSEWERRALCRLAVFRGSFSLEAAEAVLALPWPDPALDVVEVLERFVARSLLVSEHTGAALRHRQLLVLRTWSEHHASPDEWADALGRHATYFLSWSEAKAAVLGREEGVESALETELPNMLAAVDRLLAAGRLTEALRLGVVLDQLDARLGTALPLDELYPTLLSAAEHAGEESAEVLALLLGRIRRDRLAGLLDIPVHAGRALALAERLGEPAEQARALERLLAHAADAGELPAVDRWLERIRELAARLGQREALASALVNAGVARLEAGETASCIAAFEEARAHAQELGNGRLQGTAEMNLAGVFAQAGDFASARALAESARDGLIGAGARTVASVARLNLVLYSAATGEPVPESAFDELLESDVHILRTLGFGDLGLIRLADGRAEQALQVFHTALGRTIPPMLGAHIPLWRAARGAALALCGRLEEARKALPTAEQMTVIARKPRLYSDAVSIYLAHLEVVAALEAARSGTVERPSLPALEGGVFARIAARSLRPLLERLESRVREHGTIRIAPDGRGVQVNGTFVDLSRRPLLARLLAVLAEAHRERPGAPVAREAMQAAGWPGERVLPESARNRLDVAVATLRRLALGEALLTASGGYLLDPNRTRVADIDST